MAIIHRAWIFEPAAMHRSIAAAVMEDGILDTDRLREAAAAGLRSPDSHEYLDMIAFDESLLKDDIPDEAKLYVAAMAPYLRPISGILHPLMLLDELRAAGWSLSQATELVHGHPLSELSSLIADPLMNLLAPELTHSRGFGGWLGKDAGAIIYARFRDTDWRSSKSQSTARPTAVWPERHATFRAVHDSAKTLFEQLIALPSQLAIRCIAP